MASVADTNELEWINTYLAAAAALRPEDVEGVMHFTLIWNLFEGKCCGQNASITKLAEVAMRLNRAGCLRKADFSAPLAYFSNRYIVDGNANSAFERLHFRPTDRKEFVEKVLKGELTDADAVLLALLIIVFRLRNNLFHGIKELHTIGSQRDNFVNANKVLKRVLALDM